VSTAGVWNDPVRRIDAAGVCVLLAIAGGAWMALGEPVRSSRAQAADRSAELGSLAARADAAEAEAEALEAQVLELERLADDDSIRARPAGELNERLTELVAAVDAAGLRPRGVSPGTPEGDGSAVRVAIRIDGEGDYPAMTALLETLHAEHRDVTLGSLRLDRRGDGLAFGLGLVWWASPEGAALPAGGEDGP